VLTRETSKSKFPSSVRVLKIADAYPVDELTQVFTGQDAVISALPASSASLSKRIVDAAVAAGVKRLIPSEFGNNTSEAAAAQVPLYARKAEAARYLDERAREGGERGEGKGLSWTAIHCGQFFDWGLESGWLNYDLSRREVTIYDSGDRRWSTSNIGTVGTAVVKVLSRPLDDAAIRNKHLLVSSFTVSQNEVLQLLEEVDREGKKWDVKRLSSEAALEDAKKADESEALKVRVLMLLYADGEDKGANFESDDRLANEVLGLEKEDLRSVIDKLVNY